jgi:hypothetical protein
MVYEERTIRTGKVKKITKLNGSLWKIKIVQHVFKSSKCPCCETYKINFHWRFFRCVHANSLFKHYNKHAPYFSTQKFLSLQQQIPFIKNIAPALAM